MKHELVTIPCEALPDLLFKDGKEWANKHYEIITAFVLCHFSQIQLGMTCGVGIDVQDRYRREIPKTGTVTLDEIESLLTDKKNEDSPVDVWITCEKGAMGFQLKRWGAFATGKDSQALADYLNTLSHEYARTKAKLVLILESGEDIDTRTILAQLKTDDYPFAAIMFIALSDGKVQIGEFWPNPGQDSFVIESGKMRLAN